MSQAVQEILERIELLSEEDRHALEEHFEKESEREWFIEAEAARREAASRGIDQAAIDKAIEALRYGQ
ncbi:MAG TPA: hypothetical protein VGI99_03635 [Gemmataceae bacterium]